MEINNLKVKEGDIVLVKTKKEKEYVGFIVNICDSDNYKYIVLDRTIKRGLSDKQINVKELETRVGYVAVSILQDITLDYIKAHTNNDQYVGNIKYLISYQQFEKYLRGGKQ